MARYIDADKMVSEDNAYTTFPHDLAGCDDNDLVRWINEQPTADVVPKSEVDRLVDKWIGEENLTQDAMVLRLIEALRDEAKRYERYYFNHEYDKLIADAKQEVAREIFEEIENRAYGFGACFVEMTRTTFDEIKKKYTENEGKG